MLYLKYRFESLQKTPHEIGVFLGYPIWDVKGFIDNKGKDFKYCGTWKVYNNTDYAKIYFRLCFNLVLKIDIFIHLGYNRDILMFRRL